MKTKTDIMGVGLLTALLTTGTAFAAPTSPTFGTFVNAGGVPAGSKLVLNITYKVVNDEDSGVVGYWALDNYTKHVQVWQEPDGSFYAVARYTGQWTTFATALSPQIGDTEGSDASGTFEGGYVATLSAGSFTRAFGNLGTFDLGGTKADILLGTYGNGQTGDATSFDWVSTYFPDSSFKYVAWGWTYHYRNQTWNNFDYATTGDIVTK